MTVHLPDELRARLAAEAARQGKSVDALVAENRVPQNQTSQPSVGTKPKESDVQQQIKEALAQVKDEIANSADSDPEMIRLLDEQMKAAQAAQPDPSQTQASTPAPVSAVGRSRHRRR